LVKFNFNLHNKILQEKQTKTKTKTSVDEPIRPFTKQPTQTADGLQWLETPEMFKNKAPRQKRMD
jgi:hypothetical protein